MESDVQGPVNVGSSKAVTIREVVEEIGQQLGRLDLIRFGARGSDSEPFHFWANTRRLQEEVHWTPKYDLARGIKQTIEWWRAARGIREGNATHDGER
jgi:nucleoside-diphosphate-sugar epimerase